MEYVALLQGLVSGVIISAPVGPVAILCMQNTLKGRRRSGVITGLGAATADTIYAVIALKGLVFGLQSEAMQHPVFKLAIGVILLVFGLRIWAAKPHAQAPVVKLSFMSGAFLQGFVLTILNPLAVLALATLFATLEAAAAAPVWTTVGVFLGAMGWWTLLTFIVGHLHHKLETRWIVRINQVFAVLLLGLAVFALGDGALGLFSRT